MNRVCGDRANGITQQERPVAARTRGIEGPREQRTRSPPVGPTINTDGRHRHHHRSRHRRRAAAAGAGLPGLGLVHGEPAAVVFLIVEALDRRLSLGVGVHLDEAEALAAAGVTVGDHLGTLHGPVLGEPAPRDRLRSRE